MSILAQSILRRLDATILLAAETGTHIEEFDLTISDYAELMAFVSGFDEDALARMKLDMINQTYKDYPMRFDRHVAQSVVQLEEGIAALPMVAE